MNKTLSRLLKIVIGTAAGALIGFLYYRLIGCRTGTCPLTSSALKSAVFGAAAGALTGMI